MLLVLLGLFLPPLDGGLLLLGVEPLGSSDCTSAGGTIAPGQGWDQGCVGGLGRRSVVLGGKGIVLRWVGRDRKGRGRLEGHGGERVRSERGF